MKKQLNLILKGIFVVLLVLILIVGGYFAVGLYWAEHQKQLVEQQAQDLQNTLNGLFPSTTPRPSIWTIYMSTDPIQSRFPKEIVRLSTNSPNDITFSINDILFNGRSVESYGSFALVFLWTFSNSGFHTIRVGYYDAIEIHFPQESGSPWVSGASIEMTITTNTAQGSTTFLP